MNSAEGPLFNSSSILSSGVSTQKFQGGIGQKLDRNSEDDRAEAGNISNSDEDDDGLTEIASTYVDFPLQRGTVRLKIAAESHVRLCVYILRISRGLI